MHLFGFFIRTKVLCYRGHKARRDVPNEGKKHESINEEGCNQSLKVQWNSPQDDFIKHSCGVTACRGNVPEATLFLHLIERPECRREGTTDFHPPQL